MCGGCGWAAVHLGGLDGGLSGEGQCTERDWIDFYECQDNIFEDYGDDDLCFTYGAIFTKCAPECVCGDDEFRGSFEYFWEEFGCNGGLPLNCKNENLGFLDSYCTVDASGQYCLLSDDTENLMMAMNEIRDAYELAGVQGQYFIRNATRPHLEVRTCGDCFASCCTLRMSATTSCALAHVGLGMGVHVLLAVGQRVARGLADVLVLVVR